jgi:hypothetical protein
VRRSVTKRSKNWLADGGDALPAPQLLGVLCAACGLTVVILGTRLTFFNDEWYFLLWRPGFTADSIFAPHNGHLSALPVLLYKGLVALFGLESQLPFRLALATSIVALGVLVYLLVSERVGRLLGLSASAVVMFLGPAWEDLLWSFQIGLVGSLATGLAVIYVMERDSARRNLVACLLLVTSVSLSDLGIPFVVAATIAVLLRGRPRQLWIPGIPTLLFGIWWAVYGSDAPSSVSMANIRGLPKYVIDSVASGLVSATGLSAVADAAWEHRLLLLAVAIGVTTWLLRGARPSARVLILVAPALTFWGLAGANYIPGREPLASRYQLVHATLLLLIAAELFRGIRLNRRYAAASLGVTVVIVCANLEPYRDGYAFMRHASASAKTALGGLEITRGHSAPTYLLSEAVARDPYLGGVIAGPYFAETDAHGSPPTYTPKQIAVAPPEQRQAADSVIVGGYGIHLEAASATSHDTDCRRLRRSTEGGLAEARIPVGGAWLVNLGEASLDIGVRRFGPPSLVVDLGSLDRGVAAHITVPRDSVQRPWRLSADGRSALRLCGLERG